MWAQFGRDWTWKPKGRLSANRTGKQTSRLGPLRCSTRAVAALAGGQRSDDVNSP